MVEQHVENEILDKLDRDFVGPIYEGISAKKLAFTMSYVDYYRLKEKAERDGFTVYSILKNLVHKYIEED